MADHASLPSSSAASSEPSVLRGALSGFDKKGLLTSMGIGAVVAVGVHTCLPVIMEGIGWTFGVVGLSVPTSAALTATLTALGAGSAAGVIAAAADAAVVHGASHVVVSGTVGARQSLAESRRHKLIGKLIGARGQGNLSPAIATATAMAPSVPSFNPVSFLPDPGAFQFDRELPDNKTVKELVEQGLNRRMNENGVMLHGVDRAGEEASQPLGLSR